MYLLGFDIGSSSIKAALVNAKTQQTIGITQAPKSEMEIMATQANWAEQDPNVWWKNVCLAAKELLQKYAISSTDIKGIGIAYQMHGLVLVDKDYEVLRPSIIWCDSRAVEIGNDAFSAIGKERCLKHLLNSPGNFTASKLKWVKENEPDIYKRIHKMMLPGDYIAMKLTGELLTTVSGLSEGMLWDFENDAVADLVLSHYGIDKELIPEALESFSFQGKLSQKAAKETSLTAGIPITYRAGDQPNNALSLNVLKPGEIAATGGTSGVVYGVLDKPVYDLQSRVNGFAHVNHTSESNKIGILLCINGAGIQYNFVRQNMAKTGISYPEMEALASQIPIGSDGLSMIPFGNGAERMLGNKNIGSQINHLNFNVHSQSHFYRAALEGIAFSFVYGMNILKNMGLNVHLMRVGNDNLFQSNIFANTISSIMQTEIEVHEMTGAVGAAKASGVATGIYNSVEEAMKGGEILLKHEPKKERTEYNIAYKTWENDLKKLI